MLNTVERGNAAEAAIIAKLVVKGYNVLLPFGGGSRYDFVYEDRDGKFVRVQAKTARLIQNDAAVKFPTCSHSRGGNYQPYDEDADVIMAYSFERDTVYVLPVHAAPGTAVQLRLVPPKNGQVDGVRLAEEYELGRVLA